MSPLFRKVKYVTEFVALGLGVVGVVFLQILIFWERFLTEHKLQEIEKRAW